MSIANPPQNRRQGRWAKVQKKSQWDMGREVRAEIALKENRRT